LDVDFLNEGSATYGEIQIGFGKAGQAFGDEILATSGHPNPGFCLLESAERWTFPGEIRLFEMYDFVTPAAGAYWALVRYQNYMIVDTLAPVWIGKVDSDTLWFRVTE